MNNGIKSFYLPFCLAAIICMAAPNRARCATQSLLQPAAFPQTINNVSHEQRKKNLEAGYAPFKDAHAYNGLDIETQEEAWNRRIDMLEQQRIKDSLTMSQEEYCEKYLDLQKCNQTQADVDAVIASGYAQSDTSEASQPGATTHESNPSQNTNSQSGTITTIVNNNPPQQNGQCTPPDLYVEQGFTEALTRKHTTGRYFKTDQPFGKSTLAIMQSEGMTCAQDPGNPKSITCYGFMQSANTDINVRNLNLASAEDRTYKKYYKDLGINKLPDNISGDVLHVAFWRGPAKAIPTLCNILGKPCPKKGSVSDDIAQLAKNYNGDLHNDYWDQTWTELRQKNPPKHWKSFSLRVGNARNNGCHVKPRHPVPIL